MLLFLLSTGQDVGGREYKIHINVFLYLNLPFSITIFGNILSCRLQHFEVECVAFKKHVSSKLKQRVNGFFIVSELRIFY